MTTWKEVAKSIQEFHHLCMHEEDDMNTCAEAPCDWVNYPIVDGRREKRNKT